MGYGGYGGYGGCGGFSEVGPGWDSGIWTIIFIVVWLLFFACFDNNCNSPMW